MVDFKKYVSKQKPGNIMSNPSGRKQTTATAAAGGYEQVLNKITEVRDVPTDTGYISELLFKEVIDALAVALGESPVYPVDIPALAVLDNQCALKDKVDGEFLTYIS